MTYRTIISNGQPWIVSKPDDDAELRRFLRNAPANLGGSAVTVRDATDAEAARLEAALAVDPQPETTFGIEIGNGQRVRK